MRRTRGSVSGSQPKAFTGVQRTALRSATRTPTRANRHDLKALHLMFWQSPSVLLVAKSAIPSEGSWAGFWGNDAVDRKLHDIAASGARCAHARPLQAQGYRTAGDLGFPRSCSLLTAIVGSNRQSEIRHGTPRHPTASRIITCHSDPSKICGLDFKREF